MIILLNYLFSNYFILQQCFFPVAPRWIVEPPKVKKFHIASNAHLSCDVYAEPEPEITWFRDGFELVARLVKVNLRLISFSLHCIFMNDLEVENVVNSAQSLLADGHLLGFLDFSVRLCQFMYD